MHSSAHLTLSTVLLLLAAGSLVAACGHVPAVERRVPAVGPTTTAHPSSAGASIPTPAPLSWEEGTRTITIHPITADANLIELGFTVQDKSIPADQSDQVMWAASPPVTLTTVDGIPLSAQESEIGWRWNPTGGGATSNTGSTLIGTRAAFDATPLSTTSTTIELRVVTDLVRQPTGARSGPSGGAPTAVPTEPLPASAMAPVHVDRVISIPFDPLRRVAEPHLSVEGRGVTLTLERVQVTASETRLYLTGKLPNVMPGAGPQLSGDGGSWSLSSEHGGLSYVMGLRSDNTDQWGYRIGAALLDKPSPWILTLPAITETVPPGSSEQHGPWRGPWRFRFSLPAAEASLTPGPAPTLPPATPWPTDVPGAEPTFVGPLTGPVPATITPFVP